MSASNVALKGFSNGTVKTTIPLVVVEGFVFTASPPLGAGGACTTRGRFHTRRVMGRFH